MATLQPGRDCRDEQETSISVLLRIPWTLLTMVAIVMVAVLSNTLTRPPTPEQFERWGVGLDAISSGAVWKFLPSIYLVDHPEAVLSSVTLVALFVGIYEYQMGIRWTLALWFLATPISQLVAIAGWFLASRFLDLALLSTVAQSEVGSSAACWAALAAWIGWPPAWRGWRLAAGGAIVALLTLLLVDGRTFTDVEHLAAFATGAWLFGAAQRVASAERRPFLGSWLTAGRLCGALAGVIALLIVLIGVGGWPAVMLAVLGLAAVVLGLIASAQTWPMLAVVLVVLCGLEVATTINGEALAVFTCALGMLAVGAGAVRFLPERLRAASRLACGPGT